MRRRGEARMIKQQMRLTMFAYRGDGGQLPLTLSLAVARMLALTTILLWQRSSCGSNKQDKILGACALSTLPSSRIAISATNIVSRSKIALLPWKKPKIWRRIGSVFKPLWRPAPRMPSVGEEGPSRNVGIRDRIWQLVDERRRAKIACNQTTSNEQQQAAEGRYRRLDWQVKQSC